jgi:protein-S-isoprenylcysteine O-methyltransferase Ste14
MDILPRWMLNVFGLAGTLLFLGLAVVGWGEWDSFVAHPARLGVVSMTVVLVFATFFSGANLSTGRREDVANRWIFLPLAVLAIAFAWFPAFADRRDLLTLDGDGVRYLGLGLYVGGSVLRTWAIFVLGRRFSGLVAIQEDHRLVTEGVYRVIRHPSYLGYLLAILGWMLVFRSGLGLLLLLPLIWLLMKRMDAEEALLASAFGDEYAAYRQRTWRLIPAIY